MEVAEPTSSSTSPATTSDPPLIETGPFLDAVGGWRFAGVADGGFLYHLVTDLGPRCWRLSRYGNSPQAVVQAIQECNAGVVVTGPDGVPVGAAFLAEGSLVAGTAALDLFALADPDAEATVSAMTPRIVATAFDATDLRRLYHEGFVDDPQLLGDVGPLFEEEVHYPEFAWIDGAYRDRRIRCLTADRWWAEHPELLPGHLGSDES